MDAALAPVVVLDAHEGVEQVPGRERGATGGGGVVVVVLPAGPHRRAEVHRRDPQEIHLRQGGQRPDRGSQVGGALGRIGDREAVAPLLELLQDRQETASTRGYAAVALGVVCDTDRFPWGVELARDIPYLASTPTLVSSGNGVLDLF